MSDPGGGSNPGGGNDPGRQLSAVATMDGGSSDPTVHMLASLFLLRYILMTSYFKVPSNPNPKKSQY